MVEGIVKEIVEGINVTDLFDFEAKTDDYAVMGNPINHSKSPQIHTQFAAQTGQKIDYTAIHVDLGGFTQAVRNFQANGGKGLNVTVPFKLEAFRLVDKLTPRAKRAGAVNTIVCHADGDLEGDNTDGYGLVSDILNHLNWSIKSQQILILGAGGAARGIIEPILAEQPEMLYIANRTASKAKDLADDFADLGPIQGGGFNDLEERQFDLIINATAASLQGELPPLPENLLTPTSNCYDLMYATNATPFMQWATNHKALGVADGLGMLVGQAAESFKLWRQVEPEVEPVINMIRSQMK